MASHYFTSISYTIKKLASIYLIHRDEDISKIIHAVPLLFIRYLKSKVCTHYRYGLKSLISSCYNGQVSGAAYCNRAVQQATQRRVQIMSTTASHRPAALWMLSSFYYSSSLHLQHLIYHEIKRMSILFSPELDNINSNRVHFLKRKRKE